MSFLPIGPEDSVAELINLHQPDALICAGYLEAEILAELRKLALSVALVDLWAADFPCVNPDNFMADLLLHVICLNRDASALHFLDIRNVITVSASA